MSVRFVPCNRCRARVRPEAVCPFCGLYVKAPPVYALLESAGR